MCVLLFSNDFLVVEDDGLIVNIVILWFLFVRKLLNVLINVDFFFLGGFDNLIWNEYCCLFENGGVLFEYFIIFDKSFCVWWYFKGCIVFINVMVCVKLEWWFWINFLNKRWIFGFLLLVLVLVLMEKFFLFFFSFERCLYVEKWVKLWVIG